MLIWSNLCVLDVKCSIPNCNLWRDLGITVFLPIILTLCHKVTIYHFIHSIAKAVIRLSLAKFPLLEGSCNSQSIVTFRRAVLASLHRAPAHCSDPLSLEEFILNIALICNMLL